MVSHRRDGLASGAGAPCANTPLGARAPLACPGMFIARLCVPRVFLVESHARVYRKHRKCTLLQVNNSTGQLPSAGNSAIFADLPKRLRILHQARYFLWLHFLFLIYGMDHAARAIYDHISGRSTGTAPPRVGRSTRYAVGTP